MPAANGTHFEDFSVDEFHPIRRTKNSRLGHPVIVARGDPVARLRERADNMATSATALKKIADAADPLYKTLDDGQKRRLAILTHMGRFGGEGWRHHFERGMMGRENGDHDRGYDRDRYDQDGGPGRDHDGGNAPERL